MPDFVGWQRLTLASNGPITARQHIIDQSKRVLPSRIHFVFLRFSFSLFATSGAFVMKDGRKKVNFANNGVSFSLISSFTQLWKFPSQNGRLQFNLIA